MLNSYRLNFALPERCREENSRVEKRMLRFGRRVLSYTVNS